MFKQSSSGIHCKVSCNDQFRRFLYHGTEFSSLFMQVRQLLALDKEFVLKYKDTEGDLITISSDEELACALTYSDGNVLRLTAIPIGSTPVTAPSTTPCFGPFPVSEGAPTPVTAPSTTPCFSSTGPCSTAPCSGTPGSTEGHWRRRGGRCGGRRGRGRWCHEEREFGGDEFFKSNLASKRDHFKSILTEFEQYPELTPEQRSKKEWIQKKWNRIESRLERLENGSQFEDCGNGKHMKKMCKKERKMEKKMQKKNRKVLTEEQQFQITLIKSQIDMIKPGLKNVKEQLKAKKEAVKAAKGSGLSPDVLQKEISDLKESKATLKNQIQPLKQKIRELKYSM